MIIKNTIEATINKENYDFVLIDCCPPSLGMITYNGLIISDYYLIPTKADYISTYGIPQILDRITKFNEASERNVTALGIVITMYSGHMRAFHQAVIDRLKNSHSYPHVFEECCIPIRQKIAETSYFDGTTSYTLKQKYSDTYDIFKKLASLVLSKHEEDDDDEYDDEYDFDL